MGAILLSAIPVTEYVQDNWKIYVTAFYKRPIASCLYPMRSAIAEISVEGLAHQLQHPLQTVQLVRCRASPKRLPLPHIPGFVNLPLSEFAEWSTHISRQFDPHQETIVLCHHGLRSAHMCQWLTSQGFTNVKNVAGGIDAYSLNVDSSIPRY